LQFVYGAGSKWAGKAGAVYRESASKFTAFDLVCTHMGCTVVPLGAEGHCPCHHSSYSLVTGAATGGPALELNTGSLTPSKIVVSRGVIRWVKDL
jgi:Rieske Fe-S protein